MAALKSGLVAIALVVGLAGSSQAQFATTGYQRGGFATYPGTGVTSGYYGINSGFGNPKNAINHRTAPNEKNQNSSPAQSR